ncbi:type II secretion system GspH family protein [Candidatus Synechococcus calcipolaris G9]|uniref:Type II secretion system GspH family protein n=1 Tax=Candidatus Synechococcus calcipolaris G9 TaxID=1497997 RepID=A0ABT6EX05_9SYNE|nr:type II secretion system protein [Candidatus Synechococcus calcipolaris]MDG2990257.1 type II secretion system GspH family protein [Candidatus Synechococcus calcipolaris G9]
MGLFPRQLKNLTRYWQNVTTPKPQAKLMAQRGFTLTELILAASMTGVIVTLAGFGMVAMMQKDRQVEEQATIRMNLSRALDFISDDIRSGLSVSTTAPAGWTVPANYQLILYIEKPNPNLNDPGVTGVAYYTRSNTGIWRGPRVIYRATASGGTNLSPLIDGISAQAPDCAIDLTGATDSGTGKGGFRALVQNNRNVKLCVLGLLADTSAVTYRAETLAAVRSGAVVAP